MCLMELIQGCRAKQELKTIKEFIKTNIFMVIHPDERILERAILLLERHAFSDELRVIDAIIASTALTKGLSLATANYKHFKTIPRLSILKFEP